MDASVVYITCKDAAEAKSIAKETIENRLAACGNIQQNVTSIFLWKGKVDEENEVIKEYYKLIAELNAKMIHSEFRG